jgi:hypothetical protein
MFRKYIMSNIKGKGTRKFILKMSLGHTILKRHYDVQQLGCTYMDGKIL